MERHVSPVLYTLARSVADGGRPQWVRRSATDLSITEDWFQTNIFANPELVLAPCRAAGVIDDEPWYAWARELHVPDIGSIDVALVSASGRVALVETKLAHNPGNRREVVAQLLEYAVHLRDQDLDRLPCLPAGVSADQVGYRLADGDFLLMVVGDDLDPRATRLASSLLGKHLVHPWDLVFVDSALYAAEGNDSELICVPHLRGVLAADQRHVVRVHVEGSGKTRVEIVEQPPATRRRFRSYEEWLRAIPAGADHDWIRRFARELGEASARLPRTRLDVGDTELILRRDERGLVYLNPTSLGRKVYIDRKEAKRALGEQLGSEYLEALQDDLNDSPVMPAIKEPVQQRTARLLATVEACVLKANAQDGSSSS